MHIDSNPSDVPVPVWTVEFDGLYAFSGRDGPPGFGGTFYRNYQNSQSYGFVGLVTSVEGDAAVVFLSAGDVISYSGPACTLNTVRLGLDF